MSAAVGWPLALGVLGALLGSFIAALVIRWPQERSVTRGRSACDGCGHALGPSELVPLLSFAMQRGRCRRCGAGIAPLHWRIEAAAVAVGALSGCVAPSWIGLAGAVFGWLLLALAALDLVAFWLPDRLTGLLAATGAVAGIIGSDPPLAERLIGGIAGYAVLAGIARGYRVWRGRDGMGGGDPKLLGAIGLWLGWRMLPAVLVIASLIGLGIAVFAQVRGRGLARDTALPFGAMLAAAAYPAWLAMIMLAP